MEIASSTRFELVPQKLIYGGDALGHHDGRPVMVPYALPGERVEAEVVRTVKGMIHARLVQVLEPSLERVPAPCPHFGTCGGCHYQHLEASRQTEIKRDILRETLRRIGGIDWPGEIAPHSADPWRYRNQAQLKIGPDSQGRPALGFFAADSHRLVPVDACPILSPKLNEILATMSKPEWMARLAQCRELEIVVDDGDQNFMLTVRGEPEEAERLASDLFGSLPAVTTVAFQADDRVRTSQQAGARRRGVRPNRSGKLKTLGKQRIQYRVGASTYEVSAGSFFQSSRHLLPELVGAVTDNVRGDLALDLYAGVGLFTLPLAQHFKQVMAVEANPRAAADLARNITGAGLTHARATSAKATDFLRRYAQAKPDLIVLDPPRAGAEAETLKLMSGLSPQRIHYVSCQPPTLARDLAFLLRHGYRLDSVDLFDLFPQTFHIETLARLSRA